jgi:hypothetical protein
MSLRNRSLVVFSLIALISLLTASCLADSQVRIVRLSSVQGDVQIDRASGDGYEKAFDNIPVTQDAKIKTINDGRAEIEFEDGSTLRLAPMTEVAFPALALRDSGAKLSTIDVRYGVVYVNFAGQKDDEFSLNFDKQHVLVNDDARFRLLVATDLREVSVFKGEVRVEGPKGTVAVEKKHTASFSANDEPQMAKNVQELPFDEWDKSQQQYHERYMARNHNEYSPYAYGVSDLNYYGTFSFVPGYGMAWQPYFAGAGWDPYMNGAWTSYPGIGYTWVSAYPWGWVPYHYGSWINVPSNGWMWVPGGSWAGYGRTPMMMAGVSRSGFQIPTAGSRTTFVNRGPAASMTANRSNKVMISNGTAGLGISRGSLRNPGQISQRVAEKGSVTTNVRPTPAPMARPTAPYPTSAAQQQQQRASGVYTGNRNSSAPASRTSSAPAGRTMSAPSGGMGGRMGGSAPSRPSAGPGVRR